MGRKKFIFFERRYKVKIDVQSKIPTMKLLLIVESNEQILFEVILGMIIFLMIFIILILKPKMKKHNDRINVLDFF